jgi:hypothetical protein
LGLAEELMNIGGSVIRQFGASVLAEQLPETAVLLFCLLKFLLLVLRA